MAYATYSDVQARLPGLATFSASTKPTQAQVTQWLVEADAMLNGALLAAELTSPNEDTRGLEILKSWAADYGEGHVRMGLAASGGDGNNADGKDLIDRFLARIDDIPNDPAKYGAMLEGGGTPEDAIFVRGPTVDADGDALEPIIANDEDVSDLGSQF